MQSLSPSSPSVSPSPFIALKADLGEALLTRLPPDSTLRFSSWKLDPEQESGQSERGELGEGPTSVRSPDLSVVLADGLAVALPATPLGLALGVYHGVPGGVL